MPNYEFIKSPNFSERNYDINGIINHFTAGGDIEGTIKWFKNTISYSSAHYVISRSGRIVQMVPEDKAAWHSGSKTTTPTLNGMTKLNRWTIGIELCNWGLIYKEKEDTEFVFKGIKFKRKANTYYTPYKYWTNEYKLPENLINIEYKSEYLKNIPYWPGGDIGYYWEKFPEVQIDAFKALLKDILTRRPNIKKEFIVRHQDVDPTRKIDTGPALDLSKIITEVFSNV